MRSLILTTVFFIMIPILIFAQQIDHVSLVYKDFDKAEAYYEDLGFTFKYTGMHKTGLINSFIKFNDNSYIEIMSTDGVAVDPLTKHYRKLIKKGEGGAYLVLSGLETDDLKRKLKTAGIKYEIDKNQSWDYIRFKDEDLTHIYFINYHIEIKDTPHHLNHKNRTYGIKEVWVEGNNKVIEMLKAIGLSEPMKFSDDQHGEVQKFSIDNGCICVISEETKAAHKMRKLVFSDEQDKETLRISL